MRRTIFIHVGCGKTGSSALQNWLAQNAKALKKEGIRYPLGAGGGPRRFWLRGRSVPSDYAITSGNGVEMVDAALDGNAGTFVANALRGVHANLLFSSELFQTLNEEQLALLKQAFDRKGVSVVVIAYVRDVYDIAYSSYLQLVKRHLYTRPFSEFALAMELPQQFSVVRKFEKFFDDVRLIHYDSERGRGIEKALLETLGLSDDALPAMSDKKVNRSLSVLEAELLRSANEAYAARFPDRNPDFSKNLSDALIYGEPERQTELYLDHEVVEVFEARFGDWVRDLNDRYFGEARLRVFTAEGKHIVSRAEIPDPTFALMLSALVGAVEKFDFSRPAADSLQPAHSGNDQQQLSIADPRVAELLRDEAVNRGQTKPRDAFVLMSAAQVLRPGGPFIHRKLKRFRQHFRIADEREPDK
tara:strand:+ start:52998 stop:54245 length:1248 start_codon:yes stop_codon:yes gene_type:complete